MEPYTDLAIIGSGLRNSNVKLDLINIVGLIDIQITTFDITDVVLHAEIIRQLSNSLSEITINIDGLDMTRVDMDTPYAGFLISSAVAGSKLSALTLLNSDLDTVKLTYNARAF